MKKTFCILLTVLLLFALCACTDAPEAESGDNTENTVEAPAEWQGSDTTDTDTDTDTDTETEETTQSSGGDVWTRFY